MDRLVLAGLMNGVLASLLALVVVAATRAWRNPYFGRIAWLAVLLKLVTPPLLFMPVDTSWLEQSPESVPAQALQLVVAAEPRQRELPTVPLAIEGAPSGAVATAPVASTISPPKDESQPLANVWNDFVVQLLWRDLLQPLGAVWLAGSALLGGLAVTRIWKFQRMLSRSTVAPAPLVERMGVIAARLGLRKAPRVRIGAGRFAPLAWSLGRQPTIVLPTALVESLDSEALDGILAHELTHLSRCDGWARWLELAAVVAYWWCPVAWFARRRVQEAEEQCCDADVLRLFPKLRRGYGRALLETLEFLAGDPPLAPGATGWGSRRSLRRRFEQIARQETAPPLGAVVRRGCWTVIALLCLTAPTADSSEPPAIEAANPPQSSANAPESDAQAAASPPAPTTAMPDESTPCTLTLNDGSIINGMLIDQGEERLVVLREPKSTKDASMSMDLNPSPERLQASWKQWDLTLKECIWLTFKNLRGYRVTTPFDDENRLTISPVPDFWPSTEEFRSGAADQLRNVADCYAELHFAFEDLAARRVAEADSLQTWRRVKAKFVVGTEGGEETAEAQCRSQYFNCRAQVEAAQANIFTVENRLRYLLGLAANDGRLIRPSTPFETDERHYDWKTIHAEALANRIELRNQRELLEKHRRTLARVEAEAAKVMPENPTLTERLKITEARHCQLLVSREEAALQDMELEVAHQLRQAVRDVDLTYGSMKTNVNQRAAAEDDVVAVRAIYDVGRASIDLLLQAIQRRAHSESAHQRSLADYARAKARVEYRKGTLLEAYGIRVAE